MINNLPLFDDGNICMDLTQNKFDKIFDNPATNNFDNGPPAPSKKQKNPSHKVNQLSKQTLN